MTENTINICQAVRECVCYFRLKKEKKERFVKSKIDVDRVKELS